ncbi:hypothetical protein ACWOC1_03565 [Enterococcus quebecensis]|uniref:hypothetical protein n=1 Tax=Enterococcus quebecensis TaxID=903983 RepID=UPI000B32653A
MGLVYSSGDSSKLMSAMSSNLSTAKSTVSDLRSGSQRLTAAVDGRTLSGAAYNAGKGLFSELILPTISRVTTSMDGIQNDLVKYTGANAAISSEGFLDEDKLNMQMQLLKASKACSSSFSKCGWKFSGRESSTRIERYVKACAKSVESYGK